MSFNIGKILGAIGHFISGLWAGAEKELTEVILPASEAVTNAAKAIIDTDSADVIGSIAGAAGKAIEDKVRQGLAVLVPKLQLAQSFKTLATPEAILAAILKLLGGSDAVTKTAFYIEFSGLVAQYLADGKLTTGEAVMLAQYWYKNSPAAVAHAAAA